MKVSSSNGPQNQLIRAHRGSQRLNLQSAACMGLTSVLCIDVVFVRLGVLVGLLEVGAGVSLVYTPTFGTLSSCCTASSCLDVREMPSLVVTWNAVFGDAFSPGRRSGCGAEWRGVCGRSEEREGNCCRDNNNEDTSLKKSFYILQLCVSVFSLL